MCRRVKAMVIFNRVRLVNSWVLILLIGLLGGCSTFSISDRTKGIVNRINKLEFKSAVNVEFKSATSDIDTERQRSWFIKGLQYGDTYPHIGVPIVNDIKVDNNTKDCQVTITYNDDENRIDSWKPWVTGLSLGLIPVKYNYTYQIEVKSKSKNSKKNYNANSWQTIFLAPLFFLNVSQEEISSKIGLLSISEIVEVCD